MKRIIFLLLIVNSGCLKIDNSELFAQSISNQSSGIKYPRNITPYAIINLQNGDTLQWFWNEAEVKSAISSVSGNVPVVVHDSVVSNSQGFSTTSFVNGKVPMTIYTYSTTPLYHISAPVNSLCADVTDTSWFIKVLGTDSANWFKVR